jgi:hypothetical protein
MGKGAANVGLAPGSAHKPALSATESGAGVVRAAPRTGKAMLPDTQQRLRIMALVCGRPPADRAFPSICGSAPQQMTTPFLANPHRGGVRSNSERKVHVWNSRSGRNPS